jgi:hypothetical protein
MSSRRQFLTGVAMGSAGLLSIPGLSSARGFRRRGNCSPSGCCYPAPPATSGYGCPKAYYGQLCGCYYYYCQVVTVAGDANQEYGGGYDYVGAPPHVLETLAASPYTCAECNSQAGVSGGFNNYMLLDSAQYFDHKDYDPCASVRAAQYGALNFADNLTLNAQAQATATGPDYNYFKMNGQPIGVALWKVTLANTSDLYIGMQTTFKDQKGNEHTHKDNGGGNGQYHHHITDSSNNVYSILLAGPIATAPH